ncbi:MAG: DUF2127 domain-containing protein [Burkholderiaceae bacterium]
MPDPAGGQGRDDVAAIRLIASFEALKGLLVLAAGFGLLHALHHDLRHVAEQLIRHVHVNPDNHLSHLFLQRIDQLQHANLVGLFVAAIAYVVLRFAEATGLWLGRSWGEWLGALSGAIYLPIEIMHLVERPGVGVAVVFAFNAAVVFYLATRLWRRRAAGHAQGRTGRRGDR